jgi:two-component system response regulator
VNKTRVLYVTANAADFRLLREAMGETPDVDMAHAGNAGQVLAVVEHANRANRPNLIITSWALPEMTGAEMISRLKADPELRTIPVIVFTIATSDEQIGQMYSAGAACVILSPVDFEAFTHVADMLKRFWLGLARLPRHDSARFMTP